MPRKRPMPLRKRLAQATAPVVQERIRPDGAAFRVEYTPSGNRAETFEGVVVDHSGASVRSDPTARSEVVAWRTSFRMFVVPFGGKSGARDFQAHWAKRGIRVFPLTTAGRPARDVYRGQDVYLWGAQFPPGAPPDAGRALMSSNHVLLCWETTQAESNGTEYRRLEDQRRVTKADKLPWNHGSGFGNSETRRLSAP